MPSRIVTCLFFLLASSGSLYGQDVVDPAKKQEETPVGAQVEEILETAKIIEAVRSRLKIEAGVTEEVKKQVELLIQTAEANSAKTDEYLAKQKLDDQAAPGVAAAAKAIEDEISKLKSRPKEATKEATKETTKGSVDADLPIDELDKAVNDQKQSLADLKLRLAQIETDSEGRATQRQNIRVAIQSFDQRLLEAQEKLKSLSGASDSLLVDATRMELKTRLASLQSEKPALLSKQIRLEAEEKFDLLRLQRDLVSLKLSQAQARLTGLEKSQSAKRQLVADKAAKIALQQQKDIKTENPLLSRSYEVNTRLALRLQEVEAKSVETKRLLDDLGTQLADLRTQYRESRNRVVQIGLTGSVGAMLRKRKAELPSIQRSLSDADQIKDQINEIQFENFDLNQQMDELSKEVIIAEIVSANGEQTISELSELEGSIEELIVARKEKLAALENSLDRLFEQSFNLEASDRSLAALTHEYREYINERILWIRSNSLLFSQLEVDRTDRGLLSVSSWSEAGRGIWKTVSKSPLFYGCFSLVTVILLVAKRQFRQEIRKQGQIAARGACDTFWPTARVTVLAALIAVTVPLVPLILGLGLLNSAGAKEGSLLAALGPALLTTAWFAIPVELFRRMCSHGGLANHHFAWSDHAVDLLRANLFWASVLGTPVVFAVALLQNLDQTHGVDLVERVVFVVGMLGLTLCLYRCFSPKYGVFEDTLKANERSWANQTSAIWFAALLFVPISLAILAIVGFYYTALNLAACAYATFVFAIVVETSRALLMRFILVRRRHIHIEASRKKRESQKQARIDEKKALAAKQASGDASLEAPLLQAVANPELLSDIEPEQNIDETANQASRLISLVVVFVWAIGLWMIWTDVLPALRALDNYTVWPRLDVGATEAVELAASPSSGGEPAPVAAASPTTALTASTNPSVEASVSGGAVHRVTVRDLLIFLVISMVTIVSARNLPGLLEMLFLEQLPVDRSFRYAIKALVSYAIVIVGMILAFRALSISWSNVQWLATALTFGLAFGLQEIFANFVAGIILMFERPIRIGDWITVDEFTGVVTKIRTRATTIVNWDRKEYVIPNKDFITGRLVNWTLSDAINRIVIEVGVAYGSDVDKAKAILYEICQNDPRTVDEPPTYVAFEKFGESSLNLSVRTFIEKIENRLPVIDDLHTNINRAFIEAGIEISFPQRDLHIRTVNQGFTAAVRGDEAQSPS